jgi:hypothetical protein
MTTRLVSRPAVRLLTSPCWRSATSEFGATVGAHRCVHTCSDGFCQVRMEVQGRTGTTRSSGLLRFERQVHDSRLHVPAVASTINLRN